MIDKVLVFRVPPGPTHKPTYPVPGTVHNTYYPSLLLNAYSYSCPVTGYSTEQS